MSLNLGNKTPAQSCNDILHTPNNNQGITTRLARVYGGNGIPTPLKLSADAIEADFGKGLLSKAVLDACHLKYNNVGDVKTEYQISTTAGNIQRIRLTANLNITFLHNLDEGRAFEMTLLVEQSTGGHTITFPVAFKTPGDAAITLSATGGSIDVLKVITFDGGNVWLVYKAASDLR